MDRRVRLELVKLLHTCIRIGHTPLSGPVFYLVSFDHVRDVFTARNVHTGDTSPMHAGELSAALTDGIAHVSRVKGTMYHA